MSEILCITSNNNPARMVDWLFWHACIVKFDCVTIIDNGSDYDLSGICNRFSKKYGVNVVCIEYPDAVSQMDIYTEYCRKSEAYYFLPIDDDEYLYIGDEYHNSIDEYLYIIRQRYPSFYKYAFNSYYAFAETPIEMYIDKPYFELYNRLYVSNETKSIVNTNLRHYYQPDTVNGESVRYRESKFGNIGYNPNYNNGLVRKAVKKKYLLRGDHLGSPHNPVTKLYGFYQHSLDPQTNAVIPGIYNYFIGINTQIDTSAFIYHFKYRTLEEFEYKISARKRFADLSRPYFELYYNMDTYYRECKNCNVRQLVDVGMLLFRKYSTEIDYGI